MLFTTKWLSNRFTNFRGQALSEIAIKEVTTDSRLKTENSLFIPLIGDNFDGHDYIEEATNNGAVAVIWDQRKPLPNFLQADFPVFYVKDTLASLQELATYYRNEVNPIVIGITGSNGKTTTKDIVTSIVKTTYKTHSTQGNFNNHIGLPLTILAMGRETEVLVLEMGTSNFKEIDRLSTIAKPDYAVITNIGESHLEFFGSRQGITKAKLEIRNGMGENGYLIIDGDEELLEPIQSQDNVITCGYHANNSVRIEKVEILSDKTIFKLADGHTYTIPLLGKHHAQNAAYAIILGKKLGIPTGKIISGLLSIKLTSMRFELMEGGNGVSIINDAYNASPSSMKAAIDVVKQIKGYNEKVLILGDIFELGEQSETFHQSIANAIESPITVVFTYGNNAKIISSTVKQKYPTIHCNHFESKETLLRKLRPYLKKDSLLLFKASRSMQFESLVERVRK